MSEPMIVEPLTPSIGAEVLGVDLEDLGDPAIVDAIKKAFLDHHVLAFRDQDISRNAHKAFGRLFGELHIHPLNRAKGFEGDREIYAVKADESSKLNIGGLWHSDVSCDEVPPLGSMLLLKEGPPTGGDTLFANMHLAYETLSAPIRMMLNGLHAVHDRRRDLSFYGVDVPPEMEIGIHRHPVVTAHPETGRPVLFVNGAFTTHIEELGRAESEQILAMLHNHVAHSPALQCRVKWEPGTLVFWDNRCVQHYAVWDYRPQRRMGERVTVAGTGAPQPYSAEI